MAAQPRAETIDRPQPPRKERLLKRLLPIVAGGGAVAVAACFFIPKAVDAYDTWTSAGTSATQTHQDGDVELKEGANLRTSPHAAGVDNLCAQLGRNPLFIPSSALTPVDEQDPDSPWYKITDPEVLEGTGCAHEDAAYVNGQGVDLNPKPQG